MQLKSTCIRCNKQYKGKLSKLVEIVFFLPYNDNEPPIPPLILDVSGKGIELCGKCLASGAITELVEEIKKRAGIVQKPGLTYQLTWAR